MNLKKQYPKAWADFSKWFKKNKFDLYDIDFIDLPFEMQLGVHLKYLDEKEIDVCGDEFECICVTVHVLKEAIEEAFKIREEQLK